MKKTVHIVFLLTAMISLLSCSKKDKDNRSFLYGDWNVLSTMYESRLDTTYFNPRVDTLPAGRRTLTFGSDGHFSDKDTAVAGNSSEGTYDIKDDTLILSTQYGSNIVPVRYSYTLSGSRLTLVNTGSNSIPEGTIYYANTLELLKK